MTQQELEIKILELTTRLRNEQPLVYKQMSENSASLPDKKNPNMQFELEKYYNTLKSILK